MRTFLLCLGLLLLARPAPAALLDDATVWRVGLFSRHIALLPPVPGEAPLETPTGRTLVEAGLARHLVLLTPEQWVDSNTFNAARFPVALYLGGEIYLQTVRQPGDGDQALRRFLAGGGTLLVLPNGPFPFYYNRDHKVVNGTIPLGLQIGAFGFEAQPPGRTLAFHLNTNQALFHFATPRLPYPPPNLADQRWRSCTAPAAPGTRYLPLLTLRDERGQAYGEGLAVVEPAAGGQIVYTWFSLLADETTRCALLRDAFHFALGQRLPPPASLPVRRTPSAPRSDGQLDDPAWHTLEAGSFMLFGPQASRPAQPTTVRARWDDAHLHLAVAAQGADTADSLQLWLGHSDPPVGFSLNSRNELRPLAWPTDTTNPSRPLGAPAPPQLATNSSLSGIRSAVALAPSSWTVELSLPWSCFGLVTPPKLGATLPVQFVRLHPAAVSESDRLSLWSPTDDLTRPSRFGRLELTADPLSDDFESYTNLADPRTGWQVAAGQWRIEAGTLVGANCPGELYEPNGLRRGDQSWRDYSLTLRFKIESRGSDWRDGPWIGLRTRPNGDGYYLTLTAHDCQWHKVIFGQSTSDANCLARAPWQPDNAWHSLQLEARGHHLAARLDGRPLLETTDNAHLYLPSLRSGGLLLAARQSSASRGTTVVRWDDIRVKPLE